MELSAEFFDIFGAMAFIIILVSGILIRFKRRKLSKHFIDWIAVILIIIGALGLIIDVTIVIMNYFVG